MSAPWWPFLFETSISIYLKLLLRCPGLRFSSAPLFPFKLLAKLLHLTLSFGSRFFGILGFLFVSPLLLVGLQFLFPSLCGFCSLPFLGFSAFKGRYFLCLLTLPLQLCHFCNPSLCGESFLALFNPSCNIRRRLQGRCTTLVFELKPRNSLVS